MPASHKLYALEPDLTFKEPLPSVTASTPDLRKPWNRTHKTPPKYRARLLQLVRDPKTGQLVLQDSDRRFGERGISENLQAAFIKEANAAGQRWHNLDRGDVFANGAVVIARFKGEARTSLLLHSVPGVMSWQQLKKLSIGATERRVARPVDRTHIISRLHGDRAPGK